MPERWLPLVKHREGMKVPALIKPLACFRLNCAQATGRKGEEVMPPGSSQHPSPPNLAQLVQAAGTDSLAPRLFQHSLLTPLIPLCSPARPAVPLPGDGLEPANCTSELPRVSITGGVTLWCYSGDCWSFPSSVGQDGGWQHPLPLHRCLLNYLSHGLVPLLPVSPGIKGNPQHSTALLPFLLPWWKCNKDTVRGRSA